MPQLKLLKETNEVGQIFYSMQIDGVHLSGSVVYGGDNTSNDEYLNERYAEAVKKYEDYIANYNSSNKKTVVINEQEI